MFARSQLKLACAAVLLALAGATAGQAADAEDSVVVELFTSQGCSSCPPADALLGELAGEPGVIALSLHVDYWDHIGWKDRFASPRHTERQRGYARALGLRYVYTPQMVIDGQADVVGSRRGAVERLVAAAAAKPKPVAVAITQRDGAGAATLSVAPRAGAGVEVTDAVIWMVAFDRRQETDIERGENAGRLLAYHHVVRDWAKLAEWDGTPVELPLDLAALARDGRYGCAVLVQRPANGEILGAAMVTLPGGEG